ncbi:hypothetical protein [Calorimonas adulescens]|uniref:Uncharacterized protein n=1 Tax=Calorimonas adulescens TaxID=2606906 RepID=A0A5D8Q9Q2_9THEO|nr:hypothetical protein [Calorimonas adulescens]TZE81107.1 hypothetical protein FWJ32_10855 [Calorimonas adulescens]
MFDPEVAPILVKFLNEEKQKLNKKRMEEIALLKKNYNKIGAQIKNIVDAIAEGMYQPIMKDKIKKLENTKIKLSTDFLK